VKVLTGLLLLLVLTGCTVVAAPEPGLTAEEKQAIREKQTEGLWAATGLYPDQRPAPPPVTVVSLDDWAAAYVKCMNNAGFASYKAVDGGGFTSEPENSELERLSNYLCQMSFELEGEFDNRYSAAQIEYLYEYYSEELVPCMAARGYPPDSVPTRSEFVAQLGSWHPYFAMHAGDWTTMFGDPSVLAECPPTPPGIPDPGYAAYFE
jgi:hypothetical protein